MKKSRSSPLSFSHLPHIARTYKKQILLRIEKLLDTSDNFLYAAQNSELVEKLHNYTKGGYVTTLASGHDALLLALQSLNLTSTDEILFPVNVYPTAFPVCLVRAKAVPIDADINGQLDLNDFKRKISRRTKVAIVVHLYGLVGELYEIKNLCKKNNIILIEDCAQAFGTYYMKKPVGVFGDISCFSFYPTKNLSTLGDGGALWTKHKKIYKYILKAKSYGEEKKYLSLFLAGHSRLPEIQAAIINVYLEDFQQKKDKRKKLAALYSIGIEKRLKGKVSMISSSKLSDPMYHLFVIKTKKRRSLQKFLTEKKIPTLIHYPTPIHLLPAFKFLGYKKGDFPTSESLSKKILSLPFHEYMGEDDIKYIVDSIKKFYDK